MAFVRICDVCSEIIEDGDFIDIEYVKRIDNGMFRTHIKKTYCENCFEKEYGQGHLEELVQQHLMGSEN